MFDILNSIKKQKKFVSLYTNLNNADRFIFGKIIKINLNKLAIITFSPDGSYDGLLVKNVSDVFRIEEDTQYGIKMQKLMDDKYKAMEAKYYVLDEENITYSTLKMAYEDGQVISIWINESDMIISGIVEWVSEELCRIIQIDEYGTEDGKTTIFINNISEISYDSSTEVILYKLKSMT